MVSQGRCASLLRHVSATVLKVLAHELTDVNGDAQQIVLEGHCGQPLTCRQLVLQTDHWEGEMDPTISAPMSAVARSGGRSMP